MSDNRPVPHRFEDTKPWMQEMGRQRQARPTVDLRCHMTPDVVQAASGHTFVATCRLGDALTIPTGGHVTLEVPTTWDCHLGNCFRRGIVIVGARDQVKPGYAAYVDVTSSNEDVVLDWAVSWGRNQELVDVVVVEGQLEPGDELCFILGPEDNNLVQAQKYAQVAIFTVAVDLKGDLAYREAAEHPTVKVVGAWPDRFRIYAPSVVQPNQAFEARVLPVDIYSFNRATNYAGTAALSAGQGIQFATEAVELDQDAAPNGATVPVRAVTPGVRYITAVDMVHGLIGRSNPIGVGFWPDRRAYFGEMHSQMWHSMGTGTTAEFFQWGRDVAGLDFCAPANHYGWRFTLTEEIWREMVDTCNAFNDPGRFATLVSYEWGGAGGHKNVYYRGDDGEYAPRDPAVRVPERLWASLEGRDVLTIPHHPKAIGCVDWTVRNDEHQRLVEICSKWGLAETGGPHCVQAALAMGHRLGFVGGTDSHYGLANQGSYHVNDGNGLAAVIAPELTRDAIWQSLYDRRCYATTGDRILLDFTMDGQPLGSDLPADLATSEPRRFQMRVAGTYGLDAVELVRNNQVVYRAEPGVQVWQGEWVDETPLDQVAFAPTFEGDRPFVYYYLRVTQGNRQQAWASPIWLTQRA